MIVLLFLLLHLVYRGSKVTGLIIGIIMISLINLKCLIRRIRLECH